jgi:gluconate 5-dehydrogenase
MDLFELKGKVAVVTGGARGIGAATARLLRQAGARVETLDVDSGCDVTDEQAVKSAYARIGEIDILVNNAGASWGAPAEEHPLEAWDKVMDLNVRGVFLLTQAIGRASMIPRKRGRVINVASIAGLFGNPPGAMSTIAYNTSKGALVNFTRALATEWGKFGITVNAIAPGFFPSKMTKGLISQLGESTLARYAPLNRIGDDEDLKGSALLFASDAGKHITGQILAVDGGASAY